MILFHHSMAQGRVIDLICLSIKFEIKGYFLETPD